MRVLLLLVAYLVFSLLHISWGAPLISSADQHEIAQIQNELLRSKGCITQEMQQRYPIYQINGKWYLSMLGRTNSQFNSTALQDHSILFQNPVAGILTIKVP